MVPGCSSWHMQMWDNITQLLSDFEPHFSVFLRNNHPPSPIWMWRMRNFPDSPPSPKEVWVSIVFLFMSQFFCFFSLHPHYRRFFLWSVGLGPSQQHKHCQVQPHCCSPLLQKLNRQPSSACHVGGWASLIVERAVELRVLVTKNSIKVKPIWFKDSSAEPWGGFRMRILCISEGKTCIFTFHIFECCLREAWFEERYPLFWGLFTNLGTKTPLFSNICSSTPECTRLQH